MAETRLVFNYFYQAGFVPGLFFEICRILSEKLFQRKEQLTEKEKVQILIEIIEALRSKSIDNRFEL